MSRWHKSRCSVREGGVGVRPDGVPHCLNCLQSPDVAQLLEQFALEDSRLRIPPDEPPSELNLAWPPTVPYVRSREEETTVGAGLGAAVSQPPRESSTASTLQGQVASSVYPQALRTNQLRLLVLDSRDTPSCGNEAEDNWPVHVELETYNDNNCPEYEAVSYLWGGEDGDSSPRQPVYVGRFWDTLFQTKNCHEMLRLLRPKRGIRFLWVDALCINQNDLDERTQQVAKMAFIYGHALRVVLYLGPDMVTPLPPPSSYPARRRLEDLVPHVAQPQPQPQPFSDLHLRDLLKRRYFSRIWVVQELLLARQVLVRIRDVDFVADHRTSPSLLGRPAWNWVDTPAPWLDHISRGTINDPADLVKIGISLEASDARDNVFGVLGLLRPDLCLVPDYSISAVHTRIGFVAHCLLKGDAPNALLHPGPRNAGIYPSWVPWPALGDAAWRPGTSALDKLWREILAQSHTGTLDIHTIEVNDVPPEPNIEWHRGAHVDPATGSLHLHLVRLMALESAPIKLASSDGFAIMELSRPDSPWRFHLVFQETPRQLDLRPGNDHIFIFDGDTNPPSDRAPVILVLRRVSNKRLDFQLVACCHQVYISCSSRRGLAPMHHYVPLPHEDFRGSRTIEQSLRKLQRIIDRRRELECRHERYSHCLRRSLLQHIRASSLGREIRTHSAMQGPLGPHPDSVRGSPDMVPMLSTLRVMQGILNDERGASPSFVDAFLKERVKLTPIATSLNGVQCVELHVFLSDLETMELVFDVVVLSKASPACRWRRGPAWTLEAGPEDSGFQPITTAALENLFDVVSSRKCWEKTAEDTTMAGNQSSLHVLLPVETIKERYRRDKAVIFVELRSAGLGKRLAVEGGREDDELSLFLKWAPRLPEDGPLPDWAREDPDYLRKVPDWDPDVLEFGVDGSTYRVTIV
ncbi:hypothetical protein MAPG_05458 [Magnaporthiopsis poae ATCC 64411]|uniref:Heterokaryon incompatibility domain-containing protein n=1 Tax=Magnaporthiopsis poae (strain ATCC 64411 / 73-15) TaxID=644358 RepID=A0A0C4DZF8_MAGP6|nr:hypothetical protein MAPG_05458 [Magnaporthiopsis poae ATCC 64411]